MPSGSRVVEHLVCVGCEREHVGCKVGCDW